MFATAKRVFLFIVVNILVLTTLNFTWLLLSSYLGIDSSSYHSQLLFMCLIFGMGGAFISLGMSKFMAKFAYGVKIIDPKTNLDPEYKKIVNMVYRCSEKAGLKKMPEVGVYESPELNAFATGPSKRNSLVAVSSGLLHRMNDDQVEGVIGHEVAHIANGDMVTMTLLQGIINTLVLFLARIVARIIAAQSDRENSAMFHFVVVIVLQIAFSILGSLVVSYFSRKREYRADEGGARLAGKDKMIAALKALGQVDPEDNPDQEGLATLKISGKRGGFLALLSTHPPIEERIAKLQASNI